MTLTAALVGLAIIVIVSAYRGLQLRFGPNVLEGWRAYRRELSQHGATPAELRRARHDPEVAERVRKKYIDWVNRNDGKTIDHQ